MFWYHTKKIYVNRLFFQQLNEKLYNVKIYFLKFSRYFLRNSVNCLKVLLKDSIIEL